MRMDTPKTSQQNPTEPKESQEKPVEIGGAKRDSDPTRFLDWEINGKCVDF